MGRWATQKNETPPCGLLGSPVGHGGPPSPWSWLSWVSAAGPGSRCQVLRGTPSLGRAGSRSGSERKSSVLALTCRFGQWRWEQSVCHQEPHSFDDVCRVEGDVLHARPPVVVHVFLWGRTRRTERRRREGHSTQRARDRKGMSCWTNLDLRDPFPWGRLIDGHLDGLFIISHHDGPQRTVICVDLLIVYGPEPMEQQTFRIPGIWDKRSIIAMTVL